MAAVAAATIVVCLAVYAFWLHVGVDDADTYLKAAERLNAGHLVYSIQPGDRPIPASQAGTSGSAALLSPPLVAVLWRPLELLPSEVAIAVWWLLMTLVLAAAAGAFVVRRPVVGAAFLVVLAPSIIWQVLVGNVNALLIGGAVGIWLLVRTDQALKAGIVAGVLVVLKLIPLPLAAWVFAIRPRAGTLGLVSGGTGGFLVSLIGAGATSLIAYVGVIRDAGSRFSEWSAAAWVHDYLGVPDDLARWLPLLIFTAGIVIILRWARTRPGLSFATAVVAMTLGSGAVHYDTYALLLAAAAPLVWPMSLVPSEVLRAGTASTTEAFPVLDAEPEA